MITWINESKTLTKHISCECKCKFDGTECKSNQYWNNDKCWCVCKKHTCEKDCLLSPAICNCENGKYLPSKYYGWFSYYLWKSYKVIWWLSIPTSLNEKNKTWNTKNKIQSFYILLAFFRWGTHLYMSLFLSVCLSIHLSRFISQELYII